MFRHGAIIRLVRRELWIASMSGAIFNVDRVEEILNLVRSNLVGIVSESDARTMCTALATIWVGHRPNNNPISVVARALRAI